MKITDVRVKNPLVKLEDMPSGTIAHYHDMVIMVCDDGIVDLENGAFFGRESILFDWEDTALPLNAEIVISDDEADADADADAEVGE